MLLATIGPMAPIAAAVAAVADAPDGALLAVTDAAAGQRLIEQQGSHPEAILSMLRVASDRYGDVRRFLLANGLSQARLDRLLARLQQR